ncbi:PepSY domain-containing protein [Asticcacaulis sp. W401b]|uniref:PepSY domain-containing protein n=1 Tax=Asticcacaulis sp. W401b TaxID=3388666 RepID=UPI003970B971
MASKNRTLHNWISVGLGIPLILVGLTTFFIAHSDVLGTKKVELNGFTGQIEPLDIKTSAQLGGLTVVGTKYGAFVLTDGRAEPLKGGPKDDIRAISAENGETLFAGKKGIWQLKADKSQLVFKDDCWDINRSAALWAASCKKSGLVTSLDLQSWSAEKVTFSPEVLKRTQQPMTLDKLIMDIHTGKLFFGKAYEWVWIDLLGFATVALGVTGLVMWMRNRRKAT